MKKEEGFDLATTSFGTIGLSVGLPLLVYGFFSFFNFIPGGSVSPPSSHLRLHHLLIGFALKYAQLDPLECVTYEDSRDPRPRQLPSSPRCATTSPATDTATSSTSRRRSR